MKTQRATVLITVSGLDAPGITSEMTRLLAEANARLLDLGQAVIHGLLSLSVLFEVDPATQQPLLSKLEAAAQSLGMKLDSRLFTDPELNPKALSEKPFTYAITLIAEQISAHALHNVTAILAKYRLNIDAIERLSENELSCVEMLISSSAEIDRSLLKKELLSIATQQGVDIGLQTEGLYRRSKRLVVLDMDSTLIQNEVIDEFARERGVYEQVSAITEEAMRGKLDFNESLQKRVAALQGLTLPEIENVIGRIELTPGAEDLIFILKKLGYKTAIISGGFSVVAERFRERLGIDYAYANTLEMESGKATGRVLPPIVNAQRKADLLDVIVQQERIHLDQVIAIGDGANDLLMLEKAGLGIAFNAKPLVREKADLSISQKSLRSVLYLLGMSARDWTEVLHSPLRAKP